LSFVRTASFIIPGVAYPKSSRKYVRSGW